MSNKIGDLLPTKRYEEPEEVQIIKSFVKETFDADAGVTVQSQQIVISVSGAALAGALRMHLHTLKQRCKTEKRLQIRIV